jgi:hypothetical protein
LRWQVSQKGDSAGAAITGGDGDRVAYRREVEGSAVVNVSAGGSVMFPRCCDVSNNLHVDGLDVYLVKVIHCVTMRAEVLARDV